MNKEIRIVMTNDSSLADRSIGCDQIQELLCALNEESPYKLGHIIENLYTKYKIYVTVINQEAKEQCNSSYDNKNPVGSPTKPVNYVR